VSGDSCKRGGKDFMIAYSNGRGGDSIQKYIFRRASKTLAQGPRIWYNINKGS
jgi:hypothetical protein